MIIDYGGIFKVDIGIKGGYIIFFGKVGNLDIMEGVLVNMIIGVIIFIELVCLYFIL